jgi:hypothetical protein
MAHNRSVSKWASFWRQGSPRQLNHGNPSNVLSESKHFTKQDPS